MGPEKGSFGFDGIRIPGALSDGYLQLLRDPQDRLPQQAGSNGGSFGGTAEPCILDVGGSMIEPSGAVILNPPCSGNALRGRIWAQVLPVFKASISSTQSKI